MSIEPTSAADTEAVDAINRRYARATINRKGSGFSQLCPQCVASKFACDFHHNDYVERGFIK